MSIRDDDQARAQCLQKPLRRMRGEIRLKSSDDSFLSWLDENLLSDSEDEDSSNNPAPRPIKTPIRTPRLVIAIDYGTTSTSVAYAFPSSDCASLDDIKVVQDWGPHMGISSRIPSLISYSQPNNREYQQWGASISESSMVIKNIKEELDGSNNSLAELQGILQPSEGTSSLDFNDANAYGGNSKQTRKRPEDIVTDYLTKVCSYMHLLDGLEGSHLRSRIEVDIIITVPASWSQRGRNLLLQAVNNAGFNAETFPNLRNYTIIPEPEAAAIYLIRHLEDDKNINFLKLNQCFVVCDASSRAVKTISYRVTQLKPTLELEEISIPTDGIHGSEIVDENFKRWLRGRLGERNYKKLDPHSTGQGIGASVTEQENMTLLMRRFEEKKRSFVRTMKEIYLTLPQPMNINNILAGVLHSDLKITGEDMREFFDPCIDGIINLILGQFQQVHLKKNRVKDVFLVGGFSESPYLRDEIKESLRLRRVALRYPDKHKIHNAVVQGAVIYGIENPADGYSPLLSDLVGNDVSNKAPQTPIENTPGRVADVVLEKEPLPSTQDSSDGTVTTDYEGTALRGTDGIPESTLPTTISEKVDNKQREVEDTISIFTDNQSLGLPETLRTTLIKDIAAKVWDSTHSSLELCDDDVIRISAALPNLLKEMSLELACSANTVIEQRAIAFIRRYRGYITDFFQASRDTLDDEPASSRRNSDGFTVEEKIDLWNITESLTTDQPSEYAPSPEESSETRVSENVTSMIRMEISNGVFEQYPREDDHKYDETSGDENSLKSGNISDDEKFSRHTTIPDLPQAWSFIFGSEAFTRLLINIQIVSRLTPRQGETVEEIRNSIIEEISRSANFRERVSSGSTFSAFFQISWDPLFFLTEQYNTQNLPPIRDVITLSGNAIDAQATTCGQYVQQVWSDIGLEVLEAIQGAVHDSRSSCKSILADETILSDGTILNVEISGGFLHVNARGTMSRLANVGEQLSWMGASCRSSLLTSKICYCTPFIVTARSFVPSFFIDFTYQDLEDDSQNGSCWRQLFKNPVVARGFPILARINDEKGLEIPLNMMAGLGGAERATVFNGQLVVKGFSTMFVPTRRISSSILWHFLFNRDNSRISYSAAKQLVAGQDPVTVDYQCLPTARMFLGWASSVQLHTGTSDIEYANLGFTGSNFATAGCALSGVTISGGRFITGGASFVPGNKDRMLSLSNSEPYYLKMESASTWNVVFYDTDDRRAWLVDGGNALLHLTRARLSQKRLARNLDLNFEDFPYADSSHGRLAALISLGVIAARDHVLITDSASFGQPSTATHKWGLKDIVLGYWHILEQIQDHQEVLSNPGKSIRMTDREKLEGFGFVDIISGRTSIRPRVAYLEPSGRGWVDFLHQIQAITLMARGFGELIRPTERSNPLCKAWRQVPKGRDYLVARVAQLFDICDFGGNLDCQPLELVQGLYWHKGGHLFEPCSATTCMANCDRVQVLLPKATLGSKKYPDGLFEGEMEGAVVFGHSRRLPKFWPRNPKSGPFDDLAECDAEDSRRSQSPPPQIDFHDSGLGTELMGTDESSKVRTRTTESLPSRVSIASNAGPAVMSGAITDINLNSEPTARPSESDDQVVLPLPIAFSPPALRTRKGKEAMRPLSNLMNNLRRVSSYRKRKE
ncbi:uncharacterized protein LY89DRAFT_720573 [Mollisia scopiformis]|uniref:Uncharacterized protein n=1 Tax=Mollisia scopiformis TaxID=149040 RepID=A0A194X1Y7_MOLSC|nr:uncharacterized protein LY89DRAFT_720573 [Mollisia scopiformis]KUJ14213.1 hypothetical protein LY89DRAFT_720573 [Mollisia scopiformis]